MGANKQGETTNEKESEAAISSTTTSQSQPPLGGEIACTTQAIPLQWLPVPLPTPSLTLQPCTLLGFGSYLRSGPFGPATPLADGVGSYFHTPGLGKLRTSEYHGKCEMCTRAKAFARRLARSP